MGGIILRRGLTGAARIVAWIGIGCGLWRVFDAGNHFTAGLFPLVPVHFRTDLRMDALLWGCVAAFLFVDPESKKRLRKGYREWMFFLVVCAAVGCMAWYSQLTSLWLAMLIPAGLVGTTLHPEWTVSRLLDHPGPRFIGRMSYSLYLWQQLFLAAGWESPSPMQTFPRNILLIVAAAFISYHLIEKPCLKVGHKFSAAIRGRMSGRTFTVPLEPVQFPAQPNAQCQSGGHCEPAEGRRRWESRQQKTQVYQPD